MSSQHPFQIVCCGYKTNLYVCEAGVIFVAGVAAGAGGADVEPAAADALLLLPQPIQVLLLLLAELHRQLLQLRRQRPLHVALDLYAQGTSTPSSRHLTQQLYMQVPQPLQ